MFVPCTNPKLDSTSLYTLPLGLADTDCSPSPSKSSGLLETTPPLVYVSQVSAFVVPNNTNVFVVASSTI